MRQSCPNLRVLDTVRKLRESIVEDRRRNRYAPYITEAAYKRPRRCSSCLVAFHQSSLASWEKGVEDKTRSSARYHLENNPFGHRGVSIEQSEKTKSDRTDREAEEVQGFVFSEFSQEEHSNDRGGNGDYNDGKELYT